MIVDVETFLFLSHVEKDEIILMKPFELAASLGVMEAK